MKEGITNDFLVLQTFTACKKEGGNQIYSFINIVMLSFLLSYQVENFSLFWQRFYLFQDFRCCYDLSLVQ